MSERRAIYTVVIGEAIERLSGITLPRMQSYAERCGADFFVYDQDTVDGPYFSKFDAIIDGCERGYDRVLFLDADILVLSDEENIFDLYTCALQNEIACPIGEPPPILEYAFAEIRRNFDPQFSQSYYNSGVILLDKKTLQPLAKRLREIERIRLVLWDQCQLNWHLRTLDAPAQDLDPIWNYQYCWTQRNGNTVIPEDVRFLHFCGTVYGDKTDVVARVARDLGIL